MKWMHRISGIIAAVCMLSVAQSAGAATITSTATGGLWPVGATWIGGVAPGAADNAVIATTGANSVTLNNNTSIVNLTVNAGATLNLSNRRLRPTGATSVSGTINLGTNTGSRFEGMVTINAGGGWSNTGNVPVEFRGGLTNNGGTFTAGTGIHTFSTAAQAIGGTGPITIPSLTVTAIALTNNGILTVPTSLAGTGSLINSATGTLNIGGTSAITTLNAATVGNTVNYTGAAQTAKVTTYSNLTLSGSLAKTFATTPTVNGVLSMEGTATVVVTTGVVTYGPAATLQYNTATARTVTSEEWVTPFAATGGVIIANTGAITLNAAKVLSASVPLTINSGATLANGAFALSVAGDFTQNGTFTAGTGVFTLNGGAAVQTLSGTGPLGFANLTVNNTGGIALARNVTVTSAIVGAVTLTNTCPTDYTLTSNGGATVAHSCPVPVTVTSINTASANPTSAATVSWTVTFSASVTGGECYRLRVGTKWC